jgi:hypothetical protein
VALAGDQLMADDTKYIDIQEFCNLGYLQEVNRQLLHPLGLALEVTVWDVASVQAAIQKIFDVYKDLPMTEQTIKNIISNTLAMVGIHPQATTLSGVWDYRDDPEGINFGFQTEEEKDDARAKANFVRKEFENRRAGRFAGLNYVIQPLP